MKITLKIMAALASILQFTSYFLQLFTLTLTYFRVIFTIFILAFTVVVLLCLGKASPVLRTCYYEARLALNVVNQTLFVLLFAMMFPFNLGTADKILFSANVINLVVIAIAGVALGIWAVLWLVFVNQ